MREQRTHRSRPAEKGRSASLRRGLPLPRRTRERARRDTNSSSLPRLPRIAPCLKRDLSFPAGAVDGSRPIVGMTSGPTYRNRFRRASFWELAGGVPSDNQRKEVIWRRFGAECLPAAVKFLNPQERSGMATCDQFVFAVRNEPPSSARRKEGAALPWRSTHRMERSAARGPTEVWTKGCRVVLQAALTPRSVGKEARATSGPHDRRLREAWPRACTRSWPGEVTQRLPSARK